MERQELGQFFRGFAKSYIDAAVSILKEEGHVQIDEFKRKVSESVSSRFGIAPEMISHLANPFHWEMFNNGGRIFELHDSGKIGYGESCARFKENYCHNPKEVESLVETILNKYTEYWEVRFRTLSYRDPPPD